MESKLKNIEEKAAQEISQAQSLQDLESIRVKYLGRKGALSQILGGLATLAKEDKPRIGQRANALKQKLTSLLQSRTRQLGRAGGAPGKGIDITLPGICQELGTEHPITQTIDEICRIFISLGFKVVEGPEIETDYYNFQALNIPLEHPSRETFDTFYLAHKPAGVREVKKGKDKGLKIKDRFLLRSHTSPGQIRIMEKQKPPLAIVIPGKVFRPDAVDASHSFMFHQIEGLMVSEKIKFSDLKGVLSIFAEEMFGAKTRMRFRPHFFPFTEPSAEVDISCIICKGKGCRVCSHKGWLEVLGAGMVDPAVFEIVGYNPEKFSGFAFGMGIERLAMLKYGINDIRLFFENDLRFLRQF